MERIISKENKRLKYITKLMSSAAFRRQEGAFVCEGMRLCADALRSSAVVTFAVFSDSFLERHADFAARAASAAADACVVPDRLFSGLSDVTTPQGVLFVTKGLDKPVHFDKIKQNGKVLALDCVQDPSNLGAVLRTAEAFAFDLVVLCGCCDIYSPKVLRASMGAVFRTPFLVVDDLCSFIDGFNAYGNSFAAMLDREAIALTDADFSAPSLCVVGNEGRGISPDIADTCTYRLYIPMKGDAESLNASVAASIIMWEMIQ